MVDDMTGRRRDITGEKGFALVYMAVVVTTLLLFSGVAVDSGRAYVVKAQLSKAVDGAALAAARNLNSGNPRAEAERIFRANFPTGFMGTSSVTDPTTDPGFYSLQTVPATGANVVTVTASAKLPTTFMRLGNFTEVTVTSAGEATRRMVDLSLVLDVSSSIGAKWPAVRDAARTFVNAFDDKNDRLSLVFYGNGASVVDQMPAGRGFNKAKLIADIPNGLPGGSTAMVEGLYRGWDELRTVPSGQQSGLRVIGTLYGRRIEQCARGLHGGARRPTRNPNVRLSEELPRSRRPDVEQPNDRGSLRHAGRGAESRASTEGRPMGLRLHHQSSRDLRDGGRAIPAVRELPRLPPQRGDPVVVPVPDRGT